MKRQSFAQLINFFKNFDFQSLNQNNSQSGTKMLIQSLEESIMNGKNLIRIFQEISGEMQLQHEELVCKIDDLKTQITEEQKNSQKIASQAHSLIEGLRLQLLQKQEENRLLTEKLQNLQNELQKNQKQLQENAIDCAQLERHFSQTVEKQSQQQFLNETEQLRSQYELEISQLINELTKQKEINELLSQTISQMKNQMIKSKGSQSHQIQHSFNQQSHCQSDEKIQFSCQQINQQCVINDELALQSQQTYVLKDILNYDEKDSEIDHSSLQLSEKYNRQVSPKTYEGKKHSKNQNTQKQNINPQFSNRNINFSVSTKRTNEHEKYLKNQLKELSNNLTIEISNNRSSIENILTQNHQINHSPSHIRQFSLETNNPIDPLQSKHQSQKNIKIKQDTHFDPYYSFFILSAQCIKINSQFFEEIAQINVEEEWKNVLEQRIPMNQWPKYLQFKIFEKANIAKCF